MSGDRYGMGGRAARVSAAIMSSRILGLVREQLFAALLGASAFAEAFVVAFRIPNLLRDLFAEGALSSAFVPTFTETLQNRGRDAAFRLANVMIGAVLIVVGTITLVGIAFAPQVVALISDFKVAGAEPLAVQATRILFPFLPIVSLAALAMGQLNAQERYTAPALAPMTFNVVACTIGAYLWWSGASQEAAFKAWAVATLLGGAAQLAVQIPALRSTGFRLRPRIDWKDPGLRRIAVLMGPAVIGVAAMNVNVLVNTFFATQEAGAAAWLHYAFRLIYLPIGVFAIAIATISTTRLAQRAAAQDLDGMRTTLGEGLRLVAYLSVPSMVGLAVLREPIVRLIYERGEFSAADTAATADALLMYLFGLYAYSAVKVIAPAFYALGKARAPMTASIAAVIVNIVLNVTLFPVMGFRGLALGTAAAGVVNLTVLLLAYRAAGGGLSGTGLFGHGARVALAAALNGAAALWILTLVEESFGTAGTMERVVAVGAAVAVGAQVYIVAGRLLGLRDADALLAFVRRRR